MHPLTLPSLSHIHTPTNTTSGAGISEENQKKLFNEIVQFNPEKLQGGGGSGFGLFICKGIVDLHNGAIRVTSEGEGKGSTFSLELPMRRAPREVRWCHACGLNMSGLASPNPNLTQPTSPHRTPPHPTSPHLTPSHPPHPPNLTSLHPTPPNPPYLTSISRRIRPTHFAAH